VSDVVIEHDLRGRFGPPRDQGERPTCLAFAVSDAHAAVRDGWVPLSCEYLYYHAVRHGGGDSSNGAALPAIIAALKNEGQPVEAGWPYIAMQPADVRLWLPPANVGEVFRRAGETLWRSFDAAWSLVAAGRPAVIGMTISNAFYLPHDGIVDSTEPPDPVRRHAVVAVATGHRGTFRHLLIRNSWGRPWGFDGHAWLAESYLLPRVIGVLALKESA